MNKIDGDDELPWYQLKVQPSNEMRLMTFTGLHHSVKCERHVRTYMHIKNNETHQKTRY